MAKNRISWLNVYVTKLQKLLRADAARNTLKKYAARDFRGMTRTGAGVAVKRNHGQRRRPVFSEAS